MRQSEQHLSRKPEAEAFDLWLVAQHDKRLIREAKERSATPDLRASGYIARNDPQLIENAINAIKGEKK